jgi:hypothetical protein
MLLAYETGVVTIPYPQNKLGAVDEDRTRLNLIDSEVPSQRATTAVFW